MPKRLTVQNAETHNKREITNNSLGLRKLLCIQNENTCKTALATNPLRINSYTTQNHRSMINTVSTIQNDSLKTAS